MSRAMQLILFNRETTSFFLSVGTGLALETIFEPTTERIDDNRTVTKHDINNYKMHYFNIRTLIRNIIQSISNTNMRASLLTNKMGPKEVANTLINELEIMIDLYTDTKCVPVIFIPTYKDILSNVANSIKENDMSNVKLHMHNFIKDTIKEFVKTNYNNIAIANVNQRLVPTSDRVLITTHYAIDLLNIKSIRKLELLESHTGVIKDKSKFSSKYHNIGKRDLNVFPFQERLLYILGDNTLIKPAKISTRVELYDIAIKNKWTVYTSEARVNQAIGKAIDNSMVYNSTRTFF